MTTPDIPPLPEQAVAQRQTPGQMLRAAREARGMHLAVLSMALKVPVRQLEALERDDYQAFKGVTFVRALSQSVCRHLGIDPVPVLAGLPQASPSLQVMPPMRLDAEASSARVSRFGAGAGHVVSIRVMVLGLLMLAAAAALVWWPGTDAARPPTGTVVADSLPVAVPLGQASDPQEIISGPTQAEAPAAGSAGTAPALPVAAGPLAAGAALATPAAAAPVVQDPGAVVAQTAGSLVLRTRADTWVEVRDKSSQMVLKRQVRAGETLQLDLVAPFFIYVGRADAAELLWQGKPVDLMANAQNNETRLLIKP